MIDVLLPFYGDPDLLRAAVQSVLAQSSSDWRLVLVDDCHPDRSIESWLASLDDRRIEYHRNDTNLGANRNYRAALARARAEHFVMMGADDLMGPDYLEVIGRALAEVPGAGAVTCRVDVIDENGLSHLPLTDKVKRALTPAANRLQVLAGDPAIAGLLRGNWTYFPAVCWHRATVQAIGFRQGFDVVQDLALLIDVLRTGAPLVLAPDQSFRYRRHGGSDSATKTSGGGARFAEERRYFAAVAQELRAEGRTRAARAARYRLTSRLHAAALLPSALRSRDLGGVRRLAAHACAGLRA